VALYFGVPLVPCIYRAATYGQCSGNNGIGIAIIVWNAIFGGTLLIAPSFLTVELLDDLKHSKVIGTDLIKVTKKVTTMRSLVEWNALLWSIDDQKTKNEAGSYGRMLTVLFIFAFGLSLFVFFYNVYNGPINALVIQIYIIAIYIDACCIIVLYNAVNLENIFADAATELFKDQVQIQAKQDDSLLERVSTYSIVSFWKDKHYTVQIPIFKGIKISLSKDKFYSLVALAAANIANTVLALIHISSFHF